MGYYEKGRGDIDRIQALTLSRNVALKKIEQMTAALDEERKLIKKYEKEILQITHAELKRKQYNSDNELSKKRLITRMYDTIPLPLLVEDMKSMGCSASYVYKVLSEYRAQEGVKPTSKREETVNQVIANTQMGLSSLQIAEKLHITEPYVKRIQKENGCR